MMEAVEVSDSERERVVRDLTRFCGDGRLTLDELEERIAEVYAASSVAEIEHALRFLPATTTTPPPRPTVTSTPARQSSPIRSTKPLLSADARRGGEIALRIHLAVYLSVIGLLIVIWMMAGFGYPWPMWPAMTWGTALAIHAGVHKAVWHGRDV
jgi:hypothetical protein